jgi:hypothetical protein
VLGDDPLDGHDEDVLGLAVLFPVGIGAWDRAPVSKAQHAIHSRQD